MSEKNFVSIRIDNEQIELLEALAELDVSTLADEIRNAITSYISARTSNKDEIADRIAKIKEIRDLRLNKLLNRP